MCEWLPIAVVFGGLMIVCTVKMLSEQDSESEVLQMQETNDIKVARMAANMSRREMSNLFGIPLRTIENWEQGIRKCPPWAAALIVEKIERNMPVISRNKK